MQRVRVAAQLTKSAVEVGCRASTSCCSSSLQERLLSNGAASGSGGLAGTRSRAAGAEERPLGFFARRQEALEAVPTLPKLLGFAGGGRHARTGVCMHACTHRGTHARMHARTHRGTHARTHACTEPTLHTSCTSRCDPLPRPQPLHAGSSATGAAGGQVRSGPGTTGRRPCTDPATTSLPHKTPRQPSRPGSSA